MGKKKILMIGPLDVQGGMSVVMKNYIKSKKLIDLVELKYISTAVDGNKVKKLVIMISSLVKLVYMLLFNKFDIVHIHAALDASIYRKGLFVKICKLFDKKVILHFHASDLEAFYFDRCDDKKREIVKEIFKSADKIICLNNLMKKLLKEILDVESEILYNYLPNEAIDNYDIDSNKILMISRLTKEKGVYEAINVMNDLREYNLKLILAGDSPELKDIKSYVKSKSLDDIIYFTGWIDDDKKYTLFKDCFVSILPSHFEGIPMSILESISFGVPVIASRVGGIPEIISDNEGYLHEAKNEKELRKLIIEMYENREKRIAFSKSCLKKYEDEFTESKHIRQLYNIYSELGSDNLCQV